MVHGLLRALITVPIVVTAASAQEVTVSGMTQQWRGGNDYSPLSGVKVVVTRNRSLVTTASSEQNADGYAVYSVQVGSGEPIQVVFHLSKEYVPEIQSLSAQAGHSHQLSVALVTIKQYQVLRAGNPSLPSRYSTTSVERRSGLT